MIKINKLNKSYITTQALKDVSLTIEDGEMVAIIGKSGAGKSTLLHILGCLDNFDSGEYILDGTDVRTLSNRKKAKLRNKNIGFVFQDFSLIPYRSVKFNVMLPLFFCKYSYKKMKEQAHLLLEKLDIASQENKKVNQLSGGQKQRVAIARAMINNPNIILADEPTGALDTRTSAEIMEVFKQLNEEGKTVIIITHDPVVADACKRKIEISDGQILEEETNNKATAE
ncbi:MAG: ABC transporter ATP-binding protein [Acutalibacteraceae bacterium]